MCSTLRYIHGYPINLEPDVPQKPYLSKFHSHSKKNPVSRIVIVYLGIYHIPVAPAKISPPVYEVYHLEMMDRNPPGDVLSNSSAKRIVKYEGPRDQACCSCSVPGYKMREYCLVITYLKQSTVPVVFPRRWGCCPEDERKIIQIGDWLPQYPANLYTTLIYTYLGERHLK